MNTPLTSTNDSQPRADLHNAAIDGTAQHLKATAGAALSDIADSAQGLVRHSAEAAQQRALHLRDASCALIRERPMQSVLVAAGAGAIVVLLLGLLVRGGTARH